MNKFTKKQLDFLKLYSKNISLRSCDELKKEIFMICGVNTCPLHVLGHGNCEATVENRTARFLLAKKYFNNNGQLELFNEI